VVAYVPQCQAHGWVIGADYEKIAGFVASDPAVPGIDFLP
jgi:hypothetical protein